MGSVIEEYQRQLNDPSFRGLVITRNDGTTFVIDHAACVTIWPGNDGLTIAGKDGAEYKIPESELATNFVHPPPYLPEEIRCRQFEEPE